MAKTKIFYKETVDGSVTTPIPLENLLADKSKVSSGDNVPSELETGIREINRDLANLFQLVKGEEDRYVPANMVEDTNIKYYNKDTGRVVDLADTFGLKSLVLLDEYDRERARQRLVDGFKDGPEVDIPPSGTRTVSSRPCSPYAIEYFVTVGYWWNDGKYYIMETFYKESKEGDTTPISYNAANWWNDTIRVAVDLHPETIL